MSTAGRVPETWELDGDDARKTLEEPRPAEAPARRIHAPPLRRRLQPRAVARLRHVARAGAGRHRDRRLRGRARRQERRATRSCAPSRATVPGPASRVLTDAVTQAYNAGTSSRWLPLVLGTIGAIVTGATLFGQFERALNRLYGVEQDRPAPQKYALALLLTVTAGVCAADRVRDVRVRQGHRAGVRWRRAHDVGHGPLAAGVPASSSRCWRCSSGGRRVAASPRGRGWRSVLRSRWCCGRPSRSDSG